MQIYLPIAEVSVNAFLLLGLGGLVGILSGMFGVGGGFLMTPLLFFIGIPPAVAVATEANQIVASSFSGSSADLNNLNCLPLAEVVPMSNVDDDLPVVSLPADVFMSYVANIVATPVAASAPTTYCWNGSSITKAVVSSLFAGVIVAL